MSVEKWQQRFEAKLDALLEASKLKPADFDNTTTAPAAPAKLSAADKQAIDNAPKTPIGAAGPEPTALRVDANNAPATPAAVEPKATKSK
jgi:hypothetical protein